ncbi:hypothetical protein R5R35_005027 [Gryllus longicercus]|uniref:THAP-type domain-containing protein n=1 Tax=Gryllus longicercus TaxID=2509291 RepID=A0AAN9VUY2_9ORTH
MPHVCSAYNCSNRSDKTKDISYFRFPLENEKLTQQWVVNMKRDKWYPTKSSFICSMHFEEKIMYFVNERRRLLANAVPTIFDFPSHFQKRQSSRPSPKKRHFEEAFSPETVESANDNSGVYCLHCKYAFAVHL